MEELGIPVKDFAWVGTNPVLKGYDEPDEYAVDYSALR